MRWRAACTRASVGSRAVASAQEIARRGQFAACHVLVQVRERALQFGASPGRILFLAHLLSQTRELRRRGINLGRRREQAQRLVEPLVPQRRTRLHQQGGDALLAFEALPFDPALLLDLQKRAPQLVQRRSDLGV